MGQQVHTSTTRTKQKVAQETRDGFGSSHHNRL